MRLINAKSLRLETYLGDNIPPYSILSHTWLDEELTLQEFERPGHGAGRKGYAKIAAACAQSLKQGIKYTWVDTCCIDKTSSAELTEAINSMFEWYAKALVCYAFLADVEPDPWDPSTTSIEGSRWLKRGFTLQELLAPKRVEFYAADWTYIATRHELAPQLSLATTIAQVYLLDDLSCGSRQSLLFRANMAERMSWAALRDTTREEDKAYCLLGLFGVNIPLIYGEGGNAFLRLQEEILRRSFDPTLLAWNLPSGDGPLMPIESPGSSKLVDAVSAKHFVGCGNLVARHSPDLNWALIPQGLQMRLPVSRALSLNRHPYLLIPCFRRHNPLLLTAVPI
ncbi:heterokaryon incompatibility protein-domain-containing protein, partial [Microdochium trichocladiopsis]